VRSDEEDDEKGKFFQCKLGNFAVESINRISISTPGVFVVRFPLFFLDQQMLRLIKKSLKRHSIEKWMG
jgi:hypothetical protein